MARAERKYVPDFDTEEFELCKCGHELHEHGVSNYFQQIICEVPKCKCRKFRSEEVS